MPWWVSFESGKSQQLRCVPPFVNLHCRCGLGGFSGVCHLLCSELLHLQGMFRKCRLAKSAKQLNPRSVERIKRAEFWPRPSHQVWSCWCDRRHSLSSISSMGSLNTFRTAPQYKWGGGSSWWPFTDLDPEYPTIAVTSCYQQEKLQEFSIRSPGFCALTWDSPCWSLGHFLSVTLLFCLDVNLWAFPLLLQAAAASQSWEERFIFQDSLKSLPAIVEQFPNCFSAAFLFKDSWDSRQYEIVFSWYDISCLFLVAKPSSRLQRTCSWRTFPSSCRTHSSSCANCPTTHKHF